jgi:5-carboxyvanillate decarboxylase
MRKIAVEEHFITEEYLNLISLILTDKYPHNEVIESEPQIHAEEWWYSLSRNAVSTTDVLANKLLDVRESRIKEMDNAGVEMQILSLVSPGVQVFDAETGTEMARKCNDELAQIIKRNPKRFAGLAAISPQNPKEAAVELERSVKKLGLKGALINSHTRGEYLDNKKYWCIFETIESLGVPLYIHPRSPSAKMLQPYLEYPALAGAMMGFAADTSLHMMRLMCSGVFDQFPNLRIVLGHLGESLPYWQWRLDGHWSRWPALKTLKKLPSQYLRDNFIVSTSGMFSPAALLNSIMTISADNILFSIDYPFESTRDGARFIEEVPINDVDKEKICYRNAKRVFKL